MAISVRRLVRLATAALLALLLGAVVLQATATEPAAEPAAAVQQRPDIVLVLMDDFSLELLATMPQAQRPPHQTGVLTNTPNDPGHPIGGYEAFAKNGNLERSFNVALQRSGYTTGFVGKYLNRYEGPQAAGQAPPPGWTDFKAVLGGAYNGWGYKHTEIGDDGRLELRNHPVPDRSLPEEQIDKQYAGHVTARLALDFLRRHRDDRKPYFLEVSTYAPHGALAQVYPDNPTFPPAFRDRAADGSPTGGNCGAQDCGELSLRDLSGYDDPRGDNAPTYLRPDGTTAPAPAWRTNPITLTDERALELYRDRARMVQSVDRMLGAIQREVPDALVVLTADNGFHLGQHQLNGGKGTPYDSDTRVPLIVAGPGVQPGTRDQFVNNIDLAPTFEELAGLEPAAFRAGTSIARTLTDPRSATARHAFFEHTYALSQPGEVDLDQAAGGTIDIIPSYIAVRSARGLLVRFDLDLSWKGTSYAWELYRYDRPWEDRNVFAEEHEKPWVRDLIRRIRQWDGCAPERCRALAR